MNLKKKKLLASRTLHGGVDRIIFMPERMDEIKEAITKQDIRDLFKEGAILVKEKKGRRRKEIRKRKAEGKIKKKIKRSKIEYTILTRKLRSYVKELRKNKKISKEEYEKIRKQIKARAFRSKAHMREAIGGEKW